MQCKVIVAAILQSPDAASQPAEYDHPSSSSLQDDRGGGIADRTMDDSLCRLQAAWTIWTGGETTPTPTLRDDPIHPSMYSRAALHTRTHGDADASSWLAKQTNQSVEYVDRRSMLRVTTYWPEPDGDRDSNSQASDPRQVTYRSSFFFQRGLVS